MCMYVCVCVYMCMYVYVYVCVCECACLHKHIERRDKSACEQVKPNDEQPLRDIFQWVGMPDW